MIARRGSGSSGRAAAIALLLSCAGLMACGSTERPSSDESSSSTPAPEPEPMGDDVGETAIRVVIGDRTLSGTLQDNPAGRSLLGQLPVTLDFSDYGGQEILAEPPEPLTKDAMPAGDSAPAGTIGYYAPDGVVVLYYTDVPRYDGIVRIGRIDGDLSVLRGWSESRPVTLERAG